MIEVREGAAAPAMVTTPTGRRRPWRWRVLGLLRVTSVRYGVFAVVIGIWALLSYYLKASHAPDYVLPSPWAVLQSFGRSVRQGILPTYLAASLTHLFLAGVIGVVVGVGAGILMGINRWTARFFYPLLNFFQAISAIALIPMIIVWFGFTTLGLVVAVNYAILFPVVFNTLTGVRTVPRIYINAARTLGAGRLRVVRDVIIPGALPNILLGIRLGLTYGWRALIAAEMLFAINGLGFMVFDAQQFLDTPLIILGMIVLGVLWVFIDQMILSPLEALTIRRWGMVRS